MDKELLGKVWILSCLDSLMDQYKASRDVFIDLFQRKQMILRLIKQYKIDAKKYLKLTQTATKESHQLISKCAQKDLMSYKGGKEKIFLEGWFNEMIAKAKAPEKEHDALYQKYNQLKEQSRLRGITVQDVQKHLILLKSRLLVSKLRETQKFEIDERQLISLTVMDNLMQQFERNYEAYNRLFDRKARIISLVQKKEITAEFYKNTICQYLATNRIKNQDILFQTKREYQNLQLFHKGKLQSWFQELYRQSKSEMKEQKQILLMLKKQQEQDPVFKKLLSCPPLIQNNQQDQSHNIEKSVICIHLSEGNTSDYRDEIKRITQYKEQTKEACSEMKSVKLINGHIIRQAAQTRGQSEVIKKKFNFGSSEMNKQLNPNQRERRQLVITQTHQPFSNIPNFQPERVLPRMPDNRNSIDYRDKRQKILQFLKAMAVYEGLLYYFKQNKISYSNHKYLVDYENNKKDVYMYIERQEKDQTYDISNVAKDLFPPLSSIIFYTVEVEFFKKNIEIIKSDLQKYINALIAFRQQLKKVSASTAFIEQTTKQINSCQEDIKYLNEWPHGEYQAFPEVTYQKVIKRNFDTNKIQPDELQIEVTNVDGIDQQRWLHIHLFGSSQTSHIFKIDKHSKQAYAKQKLNSTQMSTVINGSQKYLTYKIYKKGFFGGLTLLAQKSIQTTFKDVNTLSQSVQMEQFTLGCTLRVQKPKYPVQMEIDRIKIKRYPTYEHKRFIQEELTKKLMPYSKPSASEIMV